MKKIFVLAFILIFSFSGTGRGAEAMKLTSPVFLNNEDMPSLFTCQGDDINPQLNIENVPEGTESLALIVDDPDATVGTWVHWVVYNIPSNTDVIEQNSIPGKEAMNSFGRLSFGGPCPPSGKHRYFFKLYALDQPIEEAVGDKASLEAVMAEHIIEQTELIGLYEKN